MNDYRSPIEIALGEMTATLDGEVLKAVQKVGVKVYKTELLKALEYDRGQYEKGYKDGWKAKECGRHGDCDGCRYSEGVYFRARCEGCCRNYADGYVAMVAEQTEPKPHDDYIESENDHLEARCLNCNNAKACKENHWEGCVYEPKDEKTCESCRHWKYIAKEWQCEAYKCQGYEPIEDEPQTDCSWK